MFEKINTRRLLCVTANQSDETVQNLCDVGGGQVTFNGREVEHFADDDGAEVIANLRVL